MIAIDMHVHLPNPIEPSKSILEGSVRDYFRLAGAPDSVEEMAKKYKSWDMMGVLLALDAETTTGENPISNDYIAKVVGEYPEQFIGFAAIDPWKKEKSVDELKRAVNVLGLKGMKLHPVHQSFFPNDRQFYPLYEECAMLGVPIIFHSGMAATGAGLPGGGGLKLKYSAPIPGIDDVAADFPTISIIMAHPGWPWVDEQIAVALHKPNVFIDFSGWAPMYIPKSLIDEANSRLSKKILFGSDYPYISPDRWIFEWDEMPIKDSSRQSILLDNARKILSI